MGEYASIDVDRLAVSSATETSSLAFLGSAFPTDSFSVRLEHSILISQEDSGCLQSQPSRESFTPSKAGLAVDVNRIKIVDNGPAECRICQEEENIANLETPCACSGSLKYVHRKCVQRWCNEKGDTTCEICHQPYRSGYTAPARGGNSEGISIELSGNWGIPGGPTMELRDPRILAMAAAQRHFLETEYDEYASANSNAAVFCRSAALILMALLLLRHALAMAATGADKDPSMFFTLFLLRVMVFLLPCYIMARAMNVLQRRRHQQEAAMQAAEVAILFQTGQARGVHFPTVSDLSTNEMR